MMRFLKHLQQYLRHQLRYEDALLSDRHFEKANSFSIKLFYEIIY